MRIKFLEILPSGNDPIYTLCNGVVMVRRDIVRDNVRCCFGAGHVK